MNLWFGIRCNPKANKCHSPAVRPIWLTHKYIVTTAIRYKEQKEAKTVGLKAVHGDGPRICSRRVSSLTRLTAQNTRRKPEITHSSQACGNPADLTQAAPVSSTLSIAKSMVSQMQK